LSHPGISFDFKKRHQVYTRLGSRNSVKRFFTSSTRNHYGDSIAECDLMFVAYPWYL